MLLRLSLLLITLSACACGPNAPFVDDCLIDTTLVRCSGKQGSPKNGIVEYNLTPLKANKYICRSTADFLNSRLYILTLEKNLAKCIQTPLEPPHVIDCLIDGVKGVLYCSDGTTGFTLSWEDAYKYLCASPTDFTLLKLYRDDLLKDIAACKS